MDWKERLVRFRSFWIFPSLAVALIWLTHRWAPNARFRDLLWLVPAGIAGWTLLEYGLHRFAFHRSIQNNAIRRLVNGTHLEHHAEPRIVEYLLVHTSFALGVSGMVYAILMALTRDWFRSIGLMTGIWAGFLYYESVHYRVHITNGAGKLIELQRRAHFHHHFRDSERCFGVTTPVWDFFFGTTRKRG